MRLLLDENMPTALSADFGPGYEVRTVHDMNWLGKKNGELLELLTLHEFDALVTVDKNLYRQHSPAKITVTIFLLRVFNNRLPTLRAMIPQLLAILKQPLTPGIVELRQDA